MTKTKEKSDTWGTSFNLTNLHKCRVIESLAEMPFECWIIPGASGVPRSNPMYFRRMPNGDEWLFETYGEGRFFDAKEVFPAFGPFRLLNPSAMAFKGDDRPIYKNDEEMELGSEDYD